MICPISWFCTNSSVRNNCGQIQDLWPSLQDPIVWERTTPIDELCTFHRNFRCLWVQISIEWSACWWISFREILNELQSSISLIQSVSFRAESNYLKKKSLKVWRKFLWLRKVQWLTNWCNCKSGKKTIYQKYIKWRRKNISSGGGNYEFGSSEWISSIKCCCYESSNNQIVKNRKNQDYLLLLFLNRWQFQAG